MKDLFINYNSIFHIMYWKWKRFLFFLFTIMVLLCSLFVLYLVQVNKLFFSDIKKKNQKLLLDIKRNEIETLKLSAVPYYIWRNYLKCKGILDNFYSNRKGLEISSPISHSCIKTDISFLHSNKNELLLNNKVIGKYVQEPNGIFFVEEIKKPCTICHANKKVKTNYVEWSFFAIMDDNVFKKAKLEIILFMIFSLFFCAGSILGKYYYMRKKCEYIYCAFQLKDYPTFVVYNIFLFFKKYKRFIFFAEQNNNFIFVKMKKKMIKKIFNNRKKYLQTYFSLSNKWNFFSKVLSHFQIPVHSYNQQKIVLQFIKGLKMGIILFDKKLRKYFKKNDKLQMKKISIQFDNKKDSFYWLRTKNFYEKNRR